jgi:hypothetical protein
VRFQRKGSICVSLGYTYLHNGHLALSIDTDDVGNLNNRILLGLRKVALSTLTLNIDGEHSKWSNFVPLA